MKANELMIGDWVIATNNGAVPLPGEVNEMLPRVGKVVGIDCDCVILDFVDFGFMLDCIEPVPLTPEILEKNGFDYEKTNDVWILEYGEIIIEVGIYHPDFINVSYKQITPDGTNEGNISSICKVDGSDIMTHDLQHALRLCGIEKEIELSNTLTQKIGLKAKEGKT